MATRPYIYDFRKIFDLEKKILLYSGIYANNGLMNKYLHYLSACLNFAVLILSQLSFTVVILLANNLFEVTDALVLSISMISCMHKIFHLVKNTKIICKMETMLSERIFHNSSPENEEIIKHYIGFSLLFATCLRTGCILSFIVNGFFPLINDNFKGTMLLGWNPWDRKDPIKFYSNALFQIICLAIAACLSSAFDIFAAKLIAIAIAEIEILKNNLVHIKYDSIDAIKEFNKNVLLHYGILRFVDITYSIFSMGILGQLCSSVILICVTSFQLIAVPINQSFFLLLYLFCMVCEVAAYCCFGQQLTNSSDTIIQSVYMSNWYEASPSLKKSILIFMERCKRPITLRLGGVFALSLITLTGILRSSYSYYTVLRRMNEQEK